VSQSFDNRVKESGHERRGQQSLSLLCLYSLASLNCPIGALRALSKAALQAAAYAKENEI
jgi:hypothetical protein